MKVFISWSGERSKILANHFKEWLPLLLENVSPFVSDADISAGDRWAQSISNELESSNFGIICLTPENIDSPWILFESGALSKSIADGKVLPVLLGLDFTDISGPLNQFQAKKVDKDGVWEIAKAIHKINENSADESVIGQRFDLMWSDFQKKIDAIPEQAPREKNARTQKEILEDLVSNMRGVDLRLRKLAEDTEETDYISRRWPSRAARISSGALEDMMHRMDPDSDLMILLISAGIVQNDLPWLSEVFREAYRDISSVDDLKFDHSVDKWRRIIRGVTSAAISRDIVRTKAAHQLAHDVPMLVDGMLSALADRKLALGSLDEDSPE